MALAWFGLGGNVGAVAETFAQARAALAHLAAGPMQVSGLFRSAPVGGPEQPAYVNQVLGFAPRLGPLETLQGLWEIERAHGRDRAKETRWGPRPLDIDVLVWPGTVSSDPRLVLPHPRLAQRRFVLVPLASVAPDLVVPGGPATVAELLAACPDPHWVQPL